MLVTVLLLMSSATFAQTCTGLCLQQTSCAGGGTTSISGTVYAPNGTDPLPNVLVYVPNAPVLPFSTGASCEASGQPVSGSPLVSAVTATNGTFTITNMPVGNNIPLVIQAGKWRRQVVISTVAACTNTGLPASLTHLPTSKLQGDIPKFAIVTGGVDAVECVLRKVGIADTEFTNPGGTGRVNLYQGSGSAGALINSSTPFEGQLEGTQATINGYDVVMFGCQGDQFNQAPALQTNLINYANAGGRVFATHYEYVWLYNDAPFSGTAIWDVNQSEPSPDPAVGTIDQTFPKGAQLAKWLQAIGASTTLGQIPISNLRRDQDGLVAPTQSWLTADGSVMQFTFNTPVGLPSDQQCGRVLFNEYHVEESSSYQIAFPSECTSGAITPQERLLEYSLFDLTNAGTSDIPPTVATSVSHSPSSFVQGDTGDTVTINITNTTPTIATNPSLTLNVTLPTGFSASSMAGANANTGWSCTPASLTCNRTTGLSGGASDAVMLTVAVASNAPISSGATISATVSGGGLAASTSAQDSVPVLVQPIIPVITWPVPAPITFGTALSATQLNATTTILGTFTYTATPSGGTATAVNMTTVLAPGSYTLTALFTPVDLVNYTTATASVTLTVNPSSFGAGLIGVPSPTVMTLTFNLVSSLGNGALASPLVLTKGAPGLDFTDATTGTCTAESDYSSGLVCTVNVMFTPKYAGVRYGAVVLEDTAGTVLATNYITGTGTGPQVGFLPPRQSTVAYTGMDDPTGIAVDGYGNVYVVNWGNGVVLKETLSGGSYTRSTIASGLNGPTGIAVDGAGNVYIAGYDSNEVYKETLSGGVYTQSTIGKNLGLPMGVAVDGSGNVYIADTSNDRVLVETLAAGVYTQSTLPTSGLLSPKGVAVDGSGNVYIADAGNHRIVRETFSAGGYTQSTVTSGLSDPDGVAVDGNGNLYIADSGNTKVLMVPWTGSGYGPTSTIGSDFVWPQGVAVDGGGNVFVADSSNNQAVKLDYEGAPSLSFASALVGSTSSDSPQRVTVQNIGNAPLNIPVPNSGTNPSIAANFTLDGSSTCTPVTTSGPAGTLAVGSNCTLAIDFTPLVPGPISGSLVLTDDSLDLTYAAQTVPLSGTGINPTDATSTMVSTSPNPVTSGQSVTITATVSDTPNPGKAPTGTVNFTDTFQGTTTPLNGGVPLSVNGGLATLAAALNGVGLHTITATFSGSSSYLTSIGTGSLTVAAIVPVLSFSPVTPKTYGNAPFTVSASSASPGAVSYTVTSGPASISGSTVSIIGAGTVILGATQASSGDYDVPAAATTSFTIGTAALTATADNVSIGYGAKLPGFTGTLTGVVAGDGITASYTTTATAASHAAQYPITPVLSDPNNKLVNYSAVLNSGTLTISPDQSITNLQLSAPAIEWQNSVTFTAKVTAPNATPTGTVSFLDGATTLASAALDSTGSASVNLSTLAVGTHNITAVYAGNADFIGSSSVAYTETVQDFSLTMSGGTATTLSATVMPGNTAVYSLQLAPTAGATFDGAVVLTLTGYPAGATYTIVPATIAIGSGPTTVTVTVTTARQASAATAAKHDSEFPKPLMLAFCLPLLGMRKLRRALRMQMKTSALMLVLMAILAVAGMTACGSNSGYFTQPPQTYPMTLTGTSGALHHSVTLDLTVQ